MKHKIKSLLFRKSRLSLSISLICALGASSAALAQTTPDDENANADEELTEVILVKGIRSTLRSALDAKRNADVILDGISADDLGNFPDLNLGEALQRIPGVQIDRNAERRNAAITVRGLPGSFALTTVNGLDVASAARSGRGGNPFGVFDSSIFSGANVVKSFTADIASGGLSANVDLLLKPALSRPDGQYTARVEAAYEGLTEDISPGLFVSGSKHFDDGAFAVYGTFVHKKQDFRRDSLVFNGYSNLRDEALGVDGQTFDRSTVEDDAVILKVNELRQNAEISKGHRTSAAAGIEFEVNEFWKVRADAIFTNRDLGDASNQLLRVGVNDSAAQVQLLEAPLFVGNVNGDFSGDGSVEPTYIASRIRSVDPTIRASNRTFPFQEEIFAIYPSATFDRDGWTVDFKGAYSESENVRAETLFNFTIRDASNQGNTNLTNGVFADIFTGYSDYRDYSLDLFIPSTLPDFDNAIERRSNQANAIFISNTPIIDLETGQQAISSNSGNPLFVRNDLTLVGTNTMVERELYSFAIDAKGFIDFGPIDSIEFGGRIKHEESRALSFENSLIGANVENLDNNVLFDENGNRRTNEVITRGDAFFGGNVPGAEFNNFLSVSPVVALQQLLPIDTSLATDETPVSPITGFIQSSNPRSLARNVNRNFTSERDNLELYVRANYEFESLRGNFGLRYIDTELSGRLDRPPIPNTPDATGDYTEVLPSFNLIYDITEDIVANVAYYETFEAYDLSEFSPEPTRYNEFKPGEVIEEDGLDEVEELFEPASVYNLEFNIFNLKPRSSQSFDIGVAWYNSEASIIGINAFQKKVKGTTVRERICPLEGVQDVGVVGVPEDRDDPENRDLSFTSQEFDTGPLLIDTVNLDRSGNPTCRRDLGFSGDAEALRQNPRISINRRTSVDEAVTIRGVELQISQNLSFLDNWAKGFGFTFNYTYVDIPQTAEQDFDNVSPRTFNFVGFYETDIWSVRLANNFRSEYSVEQPGTFVSGRRDVGTRSQWDLSATYNITENQLLRFQAFNLTDVVREEFIFSSNVPRQYEYDGRTFTLSYQYTL